MLHSGGATTHWQALHTSSQPTAPSPGSSRETQTCVSLLRTLPRGWGTARLESYCSPPSLSSSGELLLPSPLAPHPAASSRATDRREPCNAGVCSLAAYPAGAGASAPSPALCTTPTPRQRQEGFCSSQRVVSPAHLTVSSGAIAAERVLMQSESVGNDGQLWACELLELAAAEIDVQMSSLRLRHPEDPRLELIAGSVQTQPLVRARANAPGERSRPQAAGERGSPEARLC